MKRKKQEQRSLQTMKNRKPSKKSIRMGLKLLWRIITYFPVPITVGREN
jgi:hypothetical protein